MRHLSPHEVATLADRMAQRPGKTLHLLPATAELVIEALRFYARARAPENPLFKVERWDWKGSHVEEIVASASLIMIGKAAFGAAVEQFPHMSITLRQGARVIEKQEATEPET
jgi:hypothetical protein